VCELNFPGTRGGSMMFDCHIGPRLCGGGDDHVKPERIASLYGLRGESAGRGSSSAQSPEVLDAARYRGMLGGAPVGRLRHARWYRSRLGFAILPRNPPSPFGSPPRPTGSTPISWRSFRMDGSWSSNTRESTSRMRLEGCGGGGVRTVPKGNVPFFMPGMETGFPKGAAVCECAGNRKKPEIR
jgi:hypothetical protein